MADQDWFLHGRSARGIEAAAAHRLLLMACSALGAVLPALVPDALYVPRGCAFHPRCPLAATVCREAVPPLTDHGAGRAAACHMVKPE